MLHLVSGYEVCHSVLPPWPLVTAASPLDILKRVRMLAPSADPGVTQINWTLFSATLSLTTSPDPGLAIRDLRLCPHWNLPIMITPPGPRDSPDWFRINLI